MLPRFHIIIIVMIILIIILSIIFKIIHNIVLNNSYTSTDVMCGGQFAVLAYALC